MRFTFLVILATTITTVGLNGHNPNYAVQDDSTGEPPRTESRAPTRRDLYQYVWDFVIVGDGEATEGDLKNIASYYTRLDDADKTELMETYSSPGLSSREKRAAMRAALPNCRYGRLVTTKGQTHTGVIELRQSGFAHPHLKIDLTNGGNTTVSWHEIVELSLGQSETIVRTNTGKLIRGEIKYYRATVHCSGVDEIIVHQRDIKNVVLGSLRHVECPECFRKMEIDWIYCPYDASPLRVGK